MICPNLDAANILFNVIKMTGAWRDGGPDPARRGATGTHPDRFVDGAGS
ncbi:MAG: hypothetical protein R3E48_15285 [Burkholderiaceae bacterium]